MKDDTGSFKLFFPLYYLSAGTNQRAFNLMGAVTVDNFLRSRGLRCHIPLGPNTQFLKIKIAEKPNYYYCHGYCLGGGGVQDITCCEICYILY